MPEKIYLDDNGDPIGASAKVYLDDNGDPIGGPKAEPKEERSVGGFLGNVASSGGRFLKDTATGLVGAAKFIGDIAPGGDPLQAMARGDQVKEVFRNAPRIVSAAGSALKNRYGGMEQIKNTLYTDPVGVLSDISTAVMPAKLGLKAGGFTKLAKAAGAVEHATNPMRAIGAVAQPVAHGAANLAVRSTLRPPAAVRGDFGGSKAIADAVLKDRVFSEAGAGRKLDRSVAKADQMLAEAEAAGTPGVSAKTIADSLSGSPTETANRRLQLGMDVPDAVADRRARLLQRNTTPGRPAVPPTTIHTPDGPDGVDAAIRATNELGTAQARRIPASVFGGDNPDAVRAAQQLGPQANLVPRRLLGESRTPGRTIEMGGSPEVPAQVNDIPLTRAQTLKREAQDLAFEAAKNNNSLDQKINKSIAQSLRGGIEERVPSVGPINEQSQRLIGSKLAFGAAEDRPRALTNMLAALGGGAGFAGGGPAGAALMPLLIKAMDSPRVGAMTGIGIDALGKASGANSTAQAALIARLLGQQE